MSEAARKLVMVQTVQRPDGTIEDIPLVGPRFNHMDHELGANSMRFQMMNGWVIIEKLIPIIMFYRPYCIVEIGAGASTVYPARIAEAFGQKLYSCDKSPRKNRVYFKDHIFIQKFSKDFIKEFDDIPSVVLIDGDHRYKTAKMEFDFFFEKLIPGGVILLHDTMPPDESYISDTACGDVYKLRQELENRTDEMDCLTFPYTAGYNGLTIVLKKELNRNYWEL